MLVEDPSTGPRIERRRHARQPVEGPATIIMGPEAFVFCEAQNLSEGGACLRRPHRFHLRVGEQLMLATGGTAGAGREVKVIGLSDSSIHCAFLRTSQKQV